MATIGVNWQGNNPGSRDISDEMGSLGESLASAVNGGTPAQLRNQLRDQIYASRVSHQNDFTDAQTSYYQQKTQAEADKAAEEARVNQNRLTGGRGFTEELIRTIPKPAPTLDGPAISHDKFGYYGPQPAVVDPVQQKSYDAQVENYRQMGPAMFDAGKSFTDYGTGLGKTLSVPMIQNGNQDTFIRGNSLAGRNVGEKDQLPMNNDPSAPAIVAVDPITGQVIPKDKLTKDQAESQGYADRISDTESTLNDPMLVKKITDDFGVGTVDQFLSDKIPYIGNSMVSDDFRKIDQAARNFINAKMRRESGATIQPAEFENARRQYLPVYGDDEATLKLKAENRKRALTEMLYGSSPEYQRNFHSTHPNYGKPQPQHQPQSTQNQSPTAANGSVTPQGIPQAHIDLLRQNPSWAHHFDDLYGVGASQKVLNNGR
jgi:hypothetical protein